MNVGDKILIFSYRAKAWGKEHRYRLEGSKLSYEFDMSHFTFVLDLQGAGLTCKRRWLFHRFFLAGLPLIAVPIFAFGSIWAKESLEKALDLGLGGLMLAGLFILGAILLLVFREFYTVYRIKTSVGDSIDLIRDPYHEQEFEEFVAAIERFI